MAGVMPDKTVTAEKLHIQLMTDCLMVLSLMQVGSDRRIQDPNQFHYHQEHLLPKMLQLLAPNLLTRRISIIQTARYLLLFCRSPMSKRCRSCIYAMNGDPKLLPDFQAGAMVNGKVCQEAKERQ